MNSLEENIKKISAEIAAEKGFFLIDLVVRGQRNSPVIEVYIDGEKNVDAESCAEISRLISKQLDESGLISPSYRLDVSSPGVDRPLKFLRQYRKHINRNFEVVYKQGEQKKRFTGRLIGVEGDVITLTAGKEILEINFNNILKAKVIISFS